MVALHLLHLNTYQIDGFGGGGGRLFVHPRAVLAQIGHLALEGVDAAFFSRAAKGRLVHARRACGDHHAVQVLFLDGVLEHGLPRIGTHVLVLDGVNDARHVQRRLGDARDVDGAGDVFTAVANENPDPGH